MVYERSLPLLQDNADEALDLAFTTLAGCGLRVTERTGSTIDAVGPRPMARDGGSVIGAASRVQVCVDGGQVTLRAEFARLRRLPLILGVVVIVATVVALAPLSMLVALDMLAGYVVALAMLAIVPVLAIGPLLLVHIRRRVTAELDTLLNNLTMAGRRNALAS